MSRWVYEQFGSKKGLLRYYYHRALASLGVYRNHLRQIRPDASQRVVFICSGNICRSPLAEVYARSLGLKAASCGLNCGDNFPADPRAKEYARSWGLSLNDHKTVNVCGFEFNNSDIIVVMEPSHIKQFEQKVGKQYTVVLAGSFCEIPLPYIHDPFNCCQEFFIKCEATVMDCVRGMNA